MRKRSIKKLPRVIGLYGDQHNTNYAWVEGVIQAAKPKTIFVTPHMHIFTRFVEKRVVLRRDLRFKKFTIDHWEEAVYGTLQAKIFCDYSFLSYIKFHKGFLFILPQKFVTGGYGLRTSKRTDSVIWMAHELGLRYEIIESETPDDADQHTKHTRVVPTSRNTGNPNKYSAYGRAILQGQGQDILDAAREDTQAEGDVAALGEPHHTRDP